MLSILKPVVGRVDALFEYRRDKDLYGMPEYWGELKEVDGKLVGDCEDYCITIANKLADKGVGLDKMTLHLVATKTRPDHVILECDGWFIDCNTGGLTKRPDYRFISKRSLLSPTWQRVKGR